VVKLPGALATLGSLAGAFVFFPARASSPSPIQSSTSPFRFSSKATRPRLATRPRPWRQAFPASRLALRVSGYRVRGWGRFRDRMAGSCLARKRIGPGRTRLLGGRSWKAPRFGKAQQSAVQPAGQPPQGGCWAHPRKIRTFLGFSQPSPIDRAPNRDNITHYGTVVFRASNCPDGVFATSERTRSIPLGLERNNAK